MSESKLLLGSVTVAVGIGLLSIAIIIQGDTRQPFLTQTGVTWCLADQTADNEA